MRLNIIILTLAVSIICGCGDSNDNGDVKNGQPATVGPKPYNLILISVDTLRADYLRSYGHPIDAAPNIDKFAEKSVIFTNANSQSPWTTPSHASLFTSLYPSVLNLQHWPNPGKICPEAITLAEALRDHDYSTAGFLEAGMVSSKFGFAQGFNPYKQGFKHIHESVPACLDWLDTQKNKKFYLFLHTYDVHRYDPPDKFSNKFMKGYKGEVTKGIPLARALQKLHNKEYLDTLDEMDRRKIVSIYNDALLYVDHWLGVFFKGIEEKGLMKNTIVILTSDHGEEFWDHGKTGHGYTNFKEMLNIPLLIYHPDIPNGKRDQLVGLIDIPPLATEMLGVKTPDIWQGKSFFKFLKGEKSKRVQISYAEKGHCENKSVQIPGWKLVRSYTANKDSSIKIRNRLYNTKKDPREKKNVIKENPKVAAGLKRLLDQWIEDNNKRKNNFKAGKVELDPELLEQIGNLGYTDSGK